MFDPTFGTPVLLDVPDAEPPEQGATEGIRAASHPAKAIRRCGSIRTGALSRALRRASMLEICVISDWRTVDGSHRLAPAAPVGSP